MTDPKPIPTYTIGRDAADPKTGITLDELAGLVQHAMKLGLPGDTPARVIGLGWRQQFKRIELRPRPQTGGHG